MKKASLALCIACSAAVFGQSISDYRYIALPGTFGSFKGDYGLGELLSKALSSKNYIVIPSDQAQWPAEAKDNPCNVLTGDIINDSSFLKNKVLVRFTDCNKQVISSIKGVSGIKEYKEGYQDALKQTYASISPASPAAHTPARAQDAVRQTPETAGRTVASHAPVSAASVKFSNGKTDFQKVQVDDRQFILVSSNSSVPYAVFKATTKNDVFRVRLENGDETLGYYENGNIIIEILEGTEKYRKEVFSAK